MDHRNQSTPRFTYNRGTLEIMSPSVTHERLNRLIALLVEVVAEELGIEIDDLGSTTFKREDLQRGFEPDSCFYIENLEKIRGKSDFDLSVDPPPDLVVEIDITSSSLEKFSIYSHLGVPEVWRFDGSRLLIFNLVERQYVVSNEGRSFPGLSADLISKLLEQSRSLKRLAWIKLIRESVKRKAQ